jgi:cyclase
MTTTRRDFLTTSAAAALLAAVRPARLFSAPGWRLQEPVFTPIRRDVGFFTMRGGTVGYLVNDDAVAVVDSQFAAEGRALLEGLDTRSGGRAVDALINTHHHGDHTAGNVAFRGRASRVVAHATAAEHMRQPPGGQPPADALFPDTTFTDSWTTDLGNERMIARHYGRAHTSGDAVITFEQANVVHMGDLMFNQRHPVVDRAAGAVMSNWMTVLERTVADHAADTVYIFGHAGAGQPVTGAQAELLLFRDYLGAVLAFAESQIRAGRSRDEILGMRDPLPGFESFGPFGQPSARDALTCAHDEVADRSA